MKNSLERGKEQRPDAVWVCFESKSDRMTRDLMLSLDMDPVVLPLNDAWRYAPKTPRLADTAATVGPHTSIGQSPSGTGNSLSGESKKKRDPGSSPGEARPYDLRRTWRDLELLHCCDEVIVFHKRTGNSPWRERAADGRYAGRLYVVELGSESKKRAAKKKHVPVGA